MLLEEIVTKCDQKGNSQPNLTFTFLSHSMHQVSPQKSRSLGEPQKQYTMDYIQTSFLCLQLKLPHHPYPLTGKLGTERGTCEVTMTKDKVWELG